MHWCVEGIYATLYKCTHKLYLTNLYDTLRLFVFVFIVMCVWVMLSVCLFGNRLCWLLLVMSSKIFHINE